MQGFGPPGSRLGSRTPHAPPALTFGLPGKQSVKLVGAGLNLMRPQNSLAGLWRRGPMEHRQSRSAAPEPPKFTFAINR
jgi:hypothetical protein